MKKEESIKEPKQKEQEKEQKSLSDNDFSKNDEIP